MDVDRLKKLAGAGAGARTGGKGTVRRKKKAVHKATTTDDKRLQSTLKRLNVNTIPGIEEVMLLKEDTVTVFNNPKVQASIAANTYVISGPSSERPTTEVLPSLLSNMPGGQNMEQFKAMMAGQQGGSAGGVGGAADDDDDDDDDVPDLVDTFEQS